MSGNPIQRSNAWTTGVSTAGTFLILFSVGALVVVLQQYLRMPLRLHGRHGVEWMALLLIGRLRGNRPWAGSAVGLGAASTALLPFWSFNDPLIPLWYLLPGLLVDGAFRLVGVDWQRAWFFLIPLAGLAHATKPLLRSLASAAVGIRYGFLQEGLMTTVTLHLLFGAAGGTLAYLYARAAERGRGS